MLQSPSSFLPVMALAPQENETIVDMCSAPGGKTSYIAALMKNTGALIANDINADRQKATVANLHRLGVRNAAVVNYDGRELGKHFQNVDRFVPTFFISCCPHVSISYPTCPCARVLLDAPCAGLGVISRDESIKLEKKYEDVTKLARLQKELILQAIDLLNPDSPTGGYLVYSTCSVSVEENEDVIRYALAKRYVKLVPTGLEFGVAGFKKWKDRYVCVCVCLFCF